MAKGALVLVVGPSGVGKDTLIGAARQQLAGDPRFVFPRRVVTRDAMAELEDHDTLDRETFVAQQAENAFALTWEAHGLLYGLPIALEAAIAAGQVVVSNVSRRVIPQARQRYPRCAGIVITAALELRAQRLATRGRETATEVAARLAREGAPVPEGIGAIEIDNSGRLEDGVAAFIGALRGIAENPGG